MAPGARARRLDLAQHDQGALAVAVALDPHLRLRDIGRDVADDARRMLVEHVRLDAGLAQAVGDEPRIVALLRDVDADHAGGRQATSASTSRRSTSTSGAARAGSHAYGGSWSM